MPALEQKAVDGQENPFTLIRTSKFYEVQKHLAVTRHVYNPQAVIVSKKVWDAAERRREEDHRTTPRPRPPHTSASSRAQQADEALPS